MLGFSIHSLASSNRIVVVCPINILLLLVLGAATIWPVAVLARRKPLPKGKLITISIFGVLAFALLPSGAELTLDKTFNTAVLRNYFLFHWTTERYELSSLKRASLRTGSTTSQIQLEFEDGSVRLLSELNQAGGKERAVQEINHFLGRD
ncbi:MAG TPA: hypothetical protein VKX25_08740 [Bryobacteraceae bacterium]|jgi:hypothetical protein|nr:hypothetical protein [Bryobacteraceae bacterium]